MMSKKEKVHLFLVGVCLIVMSYALGGCSTEEVVYFSAEGMLSESPMTSAQGQESDAYTNESVQEQIVVYLCGAVETPGVVVLPKGSRMNDAVIAAGGFTKDAAVTAVNLAAKLTDEQMVYVPTVDEVSESRERTLDLSGETSESGLVNINTADLYRLCSLPGIGESKAKDIIAYREEKGAFRKKEEIMQVDGIKENLYKDISDLISVK